MATQAAQHVAGHEDLRQTRDYPTKTEHFEHQRDLVAKHRNALLPPRGVMLVVVIASMVMLAGCFHLAQGVVEAFANQFHLVLIERDEAPDQVGDQ